MATTKAVHAIHPAYLGAHLVNVYGLKKFTSMANQYRIEYGYDKRDVTELTIKKYNNPESFPDGHYEWYSDFITSLVLQLFRGARFMACDMT